MTITPRTKSSSSYGSSKGTVLFGGSRYGKYGTVDGDINTVRQFEMADKSNKVLTFVYKNDTNTKKTVSYNFVFWGSTQYASTYPNRFLIEFDILYDQVTTEKVTFNANGGSVSPTSQTVTFGSAYGTLPTPTRTNYTFDGWYTAKTGGTRVTSTTTVDTFGGHTLYAHWTVKRYMITFDATGGKGYFVNKYVTYGEPYGRLPTPTKPRYDLVGWFTKETGGDKVEETDIFTLATTQKLYAHWTPAKYTVTFDDGGVVLEKQTVTYGETYGEMPIGSGHRKLFLGWFTEKNGKGTKIEEDTVVTATTITWSGMAFTYTDSAWDATAHDYMVGEWTAEEENGDRITVENTGEGEETVSFVYTQDNNAVEGSFADEDGAAIESPVALPAGDKKYAWLCLSGKPERELNAETIGKVTVRLGGNT